VLVLAIVGLFAVSVYASYDRQAAMDYALNYWDKVCSDGYYFAENTEPIQLAAGAPLPTESEGYDCAHFVSCCIGNEPNQPSGGLNVPSRTFVYGEPGAQRLTNWLLEQGAVYARSVSDLVPGDVVAYDADHNGWIEHVTLYMGNGLVAAHSLSRYSEWNPEPASDFFFLHLPGAYHPPQIRATMDVATWLRFVSAVTRIASTVFFGLL